MTPIALSVFDQSHLPILLVVGFALFAGTLGARVFQRLRIPQVVGYIVIGLVLGRSGLHFINDQTINRLRLFNFFALGVIGFMIGKELRLEVFRKFGRQFIKILLVEGITAFVLVGCLTGGLAWLITGNLANSVAMGLLLGAISSATAPAATVQVLWEYKTRGPLTTATLAIVALDDGLALVLYGIASSIALIVVGQRGGGFFGAMGSTAYHLLGAAVLGAAAGIGLNFLLRIARDRDKALTFILGALGIVIGAAIAVKVDIILAGMTLGVTLANLAPRRSRESFKMVERFTPPIYVLFFVIAGARLSIDEMPAWMWALAGAYVIGRTAGKFLGANLGARWARASGTVRKYLGLCLLSQAGVAIGLAILASDSFSGQIGSAVIMIVTATTFLVEILGPPCVKVAVKRAGEVGLNVTREDLIQSFTVADVMERSPTTFAENATFATIMRTLGETDAMAYPVTDGEGRLIGMISIAELKSGMGAHKLADWLVAFDLMEPAVDTVAEDMPLAEAVTRMHEQELDYLPVVTDKGVLVGLLEKQVVDRKLSHEILHRQQLADGQEAAQAAEAPRST